MTKSKSIETAGPLHRRIVELEADLANATQEIEKLNKKCAALAYLQYGSPTEPNGLTKIGPPAEHFRQLSYVQLVDQCVSLSQEIERLKAERDQHLDYRLKNLRERFVGDNEPEAPRRNVACGNPVMTSPTTYRGCRLPSGHEGDCSALSREG